MTLTFREQLAVDAARQTQKLAHAPYSGKRVGAAVVTEDGEFFAACNVENSDASVRICAERNAVAQAISAGQRTIATVIVIGPDDRFWPPCELCRKVIEEFAANPRVVLSTSTGRLHFTDLADVPHRPFSSNGEGVAS